MTLARINRKEKTRVIGAEKHLDARYITYGKLINYFLTFDFVKFISYMYADNNSPQI